MHNLSSLPLTLSLPSHNRRTFSRYPFDSSNLGLLHTLLHLARLPGDGILHIIVMRDRPAVCAFRSRFHSEDDSVWVAFAV